MKRTPIIPLPFGHTGAFFLGRCLHQRVMIASYSLRPKRTLGHSFSMQNYDLSFICQGKIGLQGLQNIEKMN